MSSTSNRFFGSLNHDYTKKVVSNLIKDEFAISFVNRIVDSYGDVGLGLGSEMSQLLALANLNGLDHFIKEKLHAPVYVRYMDDGRAIFKSKEEAKNALKAIDEELRKCSLKLSKKKTKLFRLSQPIEFLGWRFILKDSGRIILKPRKGKMKHQRNKLKRMFKGDVPISVIEQSLQCMVASLKWGDTYKEKQMLINYFKEEKANGQKTRNKENN